MPNVQVQITTEQLFDAIKKLPAEEQRKLNNQLIQLTEPKSVNGNHNGHRRKTPAEIEADLLDRIRLNSSLPVVSQRRYNRLRRKLQDENISSEELTELQHLNTRLEAMAVERLEAIIELARLRGMDFKTLIRELKLDKH